MRKKPAAVLLLLAAIFYLNFFARIIFSPLLPAIERDLALSHSKAGTIFLFLSCGYFIALAGSGVISSRIGHKNTIVFSTLFIGAALVPISFLSSFACLQPTFFLLGLGAGVYLPSGIATISELFTHGNWGKAFAVHELAPNLAFLTAPLCASFLLSLLHWQHIILLLAFACFTAAIFYLHQGQGGQLYGKQPDLALCMAILRQRNFLLLMVLFALGISGTIGIFNIVPLFLVTGHGMSQQDANLLVGLSRVMPLASALFGGWLADRFGNRRTIAAVLLLTGAATIWMGSGTGYLLVVSVFVQPLIGVCFFPAGFAMLARLAEPAARNVIISMAIPLAFFIGGGLAPALITLLADAGYFHTGIMLTGMFILSGTFLVFLVERSKPPTAPDENQNRDNS